ncbi:MAG: JAB domain-containing protein [Azospirillaceae bacterium]
MTHWSVDTTIADSLPARDGTTLLVLSGRRDVSPPSWGLLASCLDNDVLKRQPVLGWRSEVLTDEQRAFLPVLADGPLPLSSFGGDGGARTRADKAAVRLPSGRTLSLPDGRMHDSAETWLVGCLFPAAAGRTDAGAGAPPPDGFTGHPLFDEAAVTVEDISVRRTSYRWTPRPNEVEAKPQASPWQVSYSLQRASSLEEIIRPASHAALRQLAYGLLNELGIQLQLRASTLSRYELSTGSLRLVFWRLLSEGDTPGRVDVTEHLEHFSGCALAPSRGGEAPETGPEASIIDDVASAGREAGPRDVDLLRKLWSHAVGDLPSHRQLAEITGHLGGLAGIVSADRQVLSRRLRLPDPVVDLLTLVREAVNRCLEQEFRDRRRFRDVEDLVAYCRARIGRSTVEEFRVVFFDDAMKMLHDDHLGTGNAERITVEVRDVIKRALIWDARSFLVYHNHPSGDATPSAADIRFTRQLIEASEALEVSLDDHLVITRTGHRSLRQDGLLDEPAQPPRARRQR